MTTRRRAGSTAVAVGLAVALLAACGQGAERAGDGGDGFEISTVADSTEAAGTARFEGSYSSGDPDDPLGGRLEGEIDFANGRSVTRSSYDDPEGGGRTFDSEQRMIDGYMYFATPEIPADEETGFGTKPWTRMRFPGSPATLLPFGSSADVAGFLSTLEAMGATAQEAGADVVRGTPTTRYRVTFGEPPEVAAQIEAMDEYTFDGAEEQTLDLWADAEGRLRRLRTGVSPGADPSAKRDAGRYEVELFDYGAPVTIEAPPADQVNDYSTPTGGDPASYELVTSGSAGGTQWRVFVSGTDDSRCLAVEADVAPFLAATLGSDEGRVDLGCSSWGSASSSSSSEPDGGTVETSTFTPIEPHALPLADRRALLLSNVLDGTTGVTLRLRGGGAREVTPDNGWFAVVLEPDEVVERIVFAGLPSPSDCRLRRYGYECDSELFDPGPGAPPPDPPSDPSSSSSDSGSSSTRAPATTAP